MKQKIIFTFFCMLAAHILLAQAAPYNVVLDVTSKDSVNQQSMIRWVNEIFSSNPNAKVEVVFYGQGVDVVVKERSAVGDEMQKLAANKNLAFNVCAIAMKNHNIDKSMLVSGVSTVPDGIYEIISKQYAGWGYIKVAH